MSTPTMITAVRRTIWTSRSARIVLVAVLLIGFILAATLLFRLGMTTHVGATGNSWT